MKCQLARFLAPESPWHGWLVWIEDKRPQPGEVYTNLKKNSHITHIDDAVRVALFRFGKGRRWELFRSIKNFELLPFFAEVEPYPIEEWVAKGGEQLPTQEEQSWTTVVA